MTVTTRKSGGCCVVLCRRYMLKLSGLCVSQNARLSFEPKQRTSGVAGRTVQRTGRPKASIKDLMYDEQVGVHMHQWQYEPRLELVALWLGA